MIYSQGSKEISLQSGEASHRLLSTQAGARCSHPGWDCPSTVHLRGNRNCPGTEGSVIQTVQNSLTQKPF